MRTIACLIILANLLLADAVGAEEESSAEQVKFFESKVRPLLVQRCLKCHGEGKQEGELRLDSRAAMLQGGDSGAAIQPGAADKSLLVEAIRYESLEMPPSEPLPDEQVAVLVRWIEMGAPWPENAAVIRPSDGEKISDEDRAWWAFQPLAKPDVPTNKDDTWSRNEIDRFVLHRMQSEGLTPASRADRRALIRRLYFDLVGLPPTPAEVAAFVADESPRAYEQLVDRLLASEQYGERWGRHWLDLVRYADSDGYRIDHYRPDAWRYRDYVITAFNDDKPYDRFVQEQLAGDELFPGDPQALVATGYLRQGIYEYNNRDVRGQWKTILEDVTDTTGDVFLGMGMQCAKCHDHKFDPILQKDYYRLQAFFAPILWRDDLVAMTADERAEHDQRLAKWEAKTADLRRQIDELEAPYRKRAARAAIKKFPADIQAMIDKPRDEQSPLEHQLAELALKQVDFEYTRLDRKFSSEVKEKVLALRKQLSAFDSLKPEPLPTPMAVSDTGAAPPPTVIPGRSDEPIAPGFLTILDAQPAEIATPPDLPSTGRRAALARWLTRPDNPLSTRVIVNRIWQHHFGKGLAANPSDFGRLGEQPSHGELLDWLTLRFVGDGWSFKTMHRLIVTSATYCQSTRHPQSAKFQTIDPENRFYWRGTTRRLDAEQIRDAMLAASGQLKVDQRGGPGVDPDVPRRSIYTRYMRNARDPLLDAFDLPQFFSSESSRNTTTTPVQSLLMINSQQMLRHASRLADRVAAAGENDEQRVVAAWQLAYGRPPRDDERQLALKMLRQEAVETPDDDSSRSTADVLTGKIPYRDGQAIRLNPDGAQHRLQTPHDKRLDVGEFTVEAYFQVRSIYESGSVRTVAAKWTGDAKDPGWSFGVTGRGSRRKPQTLVLQMYGKLQGGTFGEAAVFSDQHIEINRPYFAAAAVQLAGEGPGTVTFYLKDLSNDDEPLLIAKVPHEITGGFENREPLTIGGRSSHRPGFFDGLIDDVRLTGEPLSAEKLLYTAEGTTAGTLAYWQFEGDPGVFRDSSASEQHLRPFAKSATAAHTPRRAALIDLCHGLLNSNEFLYVQ